MYHALGSMYLYLAISIGIRICEIFLEIHVLHWDTWYYIGLHGRDATLSQLVHGPLRDGSLTRLDSSVHMHAWLFQPHVGCWLRFLKTSIRWLHIVTSWYNIYRVMWHWPNCLFWGVICVTLYWMLILDIPHMAWHNSCWEFVSHGDDLFLASWSLLEERPSTWAYG
jgi:hypothetical protein